MINLLLLACQIGTILFPVILITCPLLRKIDQFGHLSSQIWLLIDWNLEKCKKLGYLVMFFENMIPV